MLVYVDIGYSFQPSFESDPVLLNKANMEDIDYIFALSIIPFIRNFAFRLFVEFNHRQS